MLYKHTDNLIQNEGKYIFYFNENKIFFTGAALGWHPYVPTAEELSTLKSEYAAWCEQFNQPQNADLMSHLSGGLELYKSELLAYLSEVADKFEANLNKAMYFTSSLGFKVNGDRRTKDNLQDLVTFFDLQAVDGKIQYRDYDNVNRELTKEQVQTLLVEHVGNGQALYVQKWNLQTQINEATTLDDLSTIKITFAMADYTPPVEEEPQEPTTEAASPQTVEAKTTTKTKRG